MLHRGQATQRAGVQVVCESSVSRGVCSPARNKLKSGYLTPFTVGSRALSVVRGHGRRDVPANHTRSRVGWIISIVGRFVLGLMVPDEAVHRCVDFAYPQS